MQGTTRTFDDLPLAESELILNSDGSLYHLGIKAEHLAEHVIIVGDPERVGQIAERFSSIECDFQNREFRTCKGVYNGIELTVVSSGIGVDNIDIVINELDAAVNIDLHSRKVKENPRSLKILRLGTSGSLQEEISIGSFVFSVFAFGLDGVPYTYMASPEKHELELQELLVKEMNWPAHLPKPYFARAHENMISHVGNDMIQGITMTANGFYGPQGRSLRLSLRDSELHDKFRQFTWRGYVITNLEMECAGLYSLGAMLGHQMGTACVILANRYTGAFTNNPQEHINSLIDSSLERLTRI